jgi:pilus assembly protein CpaB
MSETSLNDGSGGRPFGRARSGGVGATSVSTARSSGMRISKTTLLRIFVLLLAAGAGYGAIQLAGSVQEPQPVASVALPVAPVIETEDVLVANGELALGKVITPDDIAWVAWPKGLISDQALRRSATPKLREELVGSLVRSPLIKGEPVRTEKLVKGAGSGILAAMLPSGYRAMAINIDSQGSTTAGGFILPNDRVDVLRTIMRADPARPEGKIETETLLSNVRVLAIGQNIQERNGERVVTGSNATLEVAPAQATLLAQAQRWGQLSLILRSMADMGTKPLTGTGGSGQAHSMMTVGVMRGGKREEYSVPDTAN